MGKKKNAWKAQHQKNVDKGFDLTNIISMVFFIHQILYGRRYGDAYPYGLCLSFRCYVENETEAAVTIEGQVRFLFCDKKKVGKSFSLE